MSETLVLNFENQREVRGCEIVAKGYNPVMIKGNVFRFKSQSTDRIYIVLRNSHGWECSCPDFYFRGRLQGFDCKHIEAVRFWLRLREVMYQNEAIEVTPSVSEAVFCKHCNSNNVVKNGSRKTRYGKKPRYLCRGCGKSFVYEDEYNGFNGLRHDDPRVITACLDMYYRGASLRAVAEHVKQIYDVNVSYSTVYRWIRRYTEIIKGYIDNLTPQTGDTWNADEMFIQNGDKLYYLWNVMDSETRYLLSNLVSKKRSTVEAKEVFQRARNHARAKPREVVTDGLWSYKKAFNKVFYDHHQSVRHVHGVGFRGVTNNNRMERFHGSVRDREKVIRGMNGDEKAIQAWMDGYRIYHNYIKKHKALGMTPAEKAGIKLELGNNKWLGLIEKAVEHQKNSAS